MEGKEKGVRGEVERADHGYENASVGLLNTQWIGLSTHFSVSLCYNTTIKNQREMAGSKGDNPFYMWHTVSYIKIQHGHMCPHVCVCEYQGAVDSVTWWKSTEPVNHSQIWLGQDSASQCPGINLCSKYPPWFINCEWVRWHQALKSNFSRPWVDLDFISHGWDIWIITLDILIFYTFMII